MSTPSLKSKQSLPFDLLPTSPGARVPVWNGEYFEIGTDKTKVLEYDCGQSGWTDELTFFSEDTAGSNHPIDNASRDHAISQIRSHVAGGEYTPTILEIGCSSGFMLELIAKSFPKALVLGSDILGQPLAELAKRVTGIPLFKFDCTACPLPDNSVDVIVALNVLEHIENDRLALEQVFRILKPGGVAVLEIPAGPDLYDHYDRILQHFRRYERAGFTKLVKSIGFEVSYASHLGCLIYPAFYAVKKINRMKPSFDNVRAKQETANMNKLTRSQPILRLLFDIELALGRFVSYPAGIRCLFTCNKPL